VVVARPPRKLWKIGEIARHMNLSRQTIHNYTLLGLIAEEERTESGHRLYGDSVWKSLARIERLKQEGKSLSEIARRLVARGRAGGTELPHAAEAPAPVEPD
jgi:DNA-binding transcriptional MerR regulator